MPCPGLQPRSFLWLAAFLCLSVSCHQRIDSQKHHGKQLFTDETGRQIALTPNPQRIISLAPNITETLFALGLGERVIGVTTYCDFPVEAKAKEKVGDTLKPNLERIIALKPDLVLISTASQLEKITQQLDQLNIPIFITNPKTVAEVLTSIRKLGEITGTSQQAETLTLAMQTKIRESQQIVTNQSLPKVLYVLQLSPLITAGKNTFINDLIQMAGGQSISGEEAADYPQFSRETAIARAPEVIIVPQSHGTELVNVEAIKQGFAITPAVKNNRIVSVNPDLIDRPGPRIVDGLEALRKAIHGK
ncbi:MAG: cobalamin-binding protein [Acidobacteria bacterium]|nr:cobalamin-binding protein [Acidobacteriota bacterium]